MTPGINLVKNDGNVSGNIKQFYILVYSSFFFMHDNKFAWIYDQRHKGDRIVKISIDIDTMNAIVQYCNETDGALERALHCTALLFGSWVNW